jgi:hypothetical protein
VGCDTNHNPRRYKNVCRGFSYRDNISFLSNMMSLICLFCLSSLHRFKVWYTALDRRCLLQEDAYSSARFLLAILNKTIYLPTLTFR